ncbi:MAG: MobB family relaxase [Dysgonomonas sp.]
MYITITPNKKGGCSDLINYLEKENDQIRDFANYLDKENQLVEQPDPFFNGENSDIDKFEVIERIDKNCKGLSKDESRFFSLTFNPSAKEIDHIDLLAHIEALKLEAAGVGEDLYKVKEEIARNLYKEYAIKCMDNYAQNFNREHIKDNKDLVWYGKVEKDRYWKYNSPEVKQNKKVQRQIDKLEKKYPKPTEKQQAKIDELKKTLIRECDVRKNGKDKVITEMMPKSGANYHIHIVVSRRDKEQCVKLSPLAKARNDAQHKVAILEKDEAGKMVKVGEKMCQIGFDRNKFVTENEKSFDLSFNYSRSWAETYEARKLAKDEPEKYKEVLAEKRYWEKFYTEPEKATVKKNSTNRERINLQNPIFNKIIQDAGLKYLAHAKPYYTITKTAIKGISILVENKQKNIATRKAVSSNYKMISRTSQQISKNLMYREVFQNIGRANPYAMTVLSNYNMIKNVGQYINKNLLSKGVTTGVTNTIGKVNPYVAAASLVSKLISKEEIER